MPKLDLKGTAVASASTKARTTKALDILEEVQAMAGKMGLHAFPRPSTAPASLAELDPGSLSNRDLESAMTAYVAYASYIEPKLAEAESAYKISTANLKSVASSLKLSLFADGTRTAEVDARVNTSPEYIEYELEHLKLYATKEILAAHHHAYSKQAGALSRIIELRKLEFEQQHRLNNVGNHRPGDRPHSRGGLPGTIRRPS